MNEFYKMVAVKSVKKAHLYRKINCHARK